MKKQLKAAYKSQHQWTKDIIWTVSLVVSCGLAVWFALSIID